MDTSTTALPSPFSLFEETPSAEAASPAKAPEAHAAVTAPPPPAVPANPDEAMRALGAFASPREQKRTLPKGVRAGLLASVALLAGVLFLGHRHKEAHASETGLQVDEPLLVNEADLRNRKEVSPLDFRPHTRTGVLPPKETEDPLATRPPRRTDPEDLIGKKHAGEKVSPSAATDLAPTAEPDTFRRPFVYFEGPSSEGRFGAAKEGTQGKSLNTAGTTLPVVLVTPVDLDGASSTVIAEVEADGVFSAHTKFIGTASTLGEDRVSLRFRRVVLPDGKETTLEGEAQDGQSRFGLPADVQGTNHGPSVGGEIARDTASDVASELVPNYIAGNALRRVIRSRQTQSSASRVRLSLPAGIPFGLFFHDRVVFKND